MKNWWLWQHFVRKVLAEKVMDAPIEDIVAAFGGESFLVRGDRHPKNVWIERKHLHGTLGFAVRLPFRQDSFWVTAYFTDDAPPGHISSVHVSSARESHGCDGNGRALVVPSLLRALYALGIDIEHYETKFKVELTGHEKFVLGPLRAKALHYETADALAAREAKPL
jgi:hypothetical protein